MIAVSRAEREFILELNLAPSESVVLIENGVDHQDLEHPYEGNEVCEDIQDKELTFGSTMRFDPQKAPSHLVEAFIRLSRTMPQFPTRLVIAGDGELFAGVKKQIEASGLAEQITLLGWRTDLREVLREFDVFVLPSLYEGLSYSLMEAMAAKLPVISTNVSGTEETVVRVAGNIVVPAGDPKALADGMQRMTTLDCPKLLRRSLREIGQANQEYVRTHLRQSESTRRTLEIYQSLQLAGPTSG